MKTYEETFRTVIKRRDEYEAEKEIKGKKVKKIAVPAALCTVLAAAAVWIYVESMSRADLPKIEATDAADNTLNAPIDTSSSVTDNTLAPPETEPSKTEKTETPTIGLPPEYISEHYPTDETKPTFTISAETTVPDGEYSGGVGYFNIPVHPSSGEMITTGEKITDDEARSCLEERKASIVASLAASGVPTDNVTISDKGYSHVRYDGVEGEKLEVRENFRDYLVYNGDELIAIITLYKEDGKFYDTPAFGGRWFASYGEYLKAHKGQELVYVYAGFAEIILSPDGEAYSPLGLAADKYMEGLDDPYHFFYHPGDVYIP